MSIGGVSQAPLTPAFGRIGERTPQPAGSQPRSAVAPAAQAATPAAAKPEALTAAAPEGVDPALWSVLTSEERAYFAKVRSLGPLTYGPTPATARPALRGGRVDVTV